MMRDVFIFLQAGTFVGLGLLLLGTGEPKLGAAQLCLAVVTWLVYSA